MQQSDGPCPVSLVVRGESGTCVREKQKSLFEVGGALFRITVPVFVVVGFVTLPNRTMLCSGQFRIKIEKAHHKLGRRMHCVKNKYAL